MLEVLRQVSWKLKETDTILQILHSPISLFYDGVLKFDNIFVVFNQRRLPVFGS